ncbi:MAG: VWA domain-containing protein, partial [Deltaproteobacteria bacterium]|nr:VWA domain-containing protein [Deltaproteobacteria bacterium]
RERLGGLVLLAFSTVLLAGRASAQPASDLPRHTASAEVSLLGIDVVVTDKEGRPVHGLAAGDFEVRHGGRIVPITNFLEEREVETPLDPDELAESETEEESPAADLAAQRPGRHIVVFVDRLFLPELDLRTRVFGALKEFLARSLGPQDEAMIVTWGGSVRIVRSFTRDIEELDRTLDAVARRSARLDAEATELDQLAERDAWFRSIAEAEGTSTADAGVMDPDLSRSLAATQAWGEMKAKTAALRGLVALMAGMEGRKALVVVSPRFSRHPGGEYFIPKRGGLVSAGSQDSRQPLEQLADAANASGVTFYGVFPYIHDMAALPSAADSSATNPDINSGPLGPRSDAIWLDAMGGLDFIADRTGGLTAGHPGLLPGLLARVERDLDSYYSIGYSAPGNGRADRVRVVATRPGLSVRTRRTDAERTVEEQMHDRALANLFTPDEGSRLSISIAAGEPSPKGKKFRIPIEVRIPTGSLVRLSGPSSTRGKFSVFVVVATPNGDFTDVTRRRQTFEVQRGEEEKAGDSHLTYTLEVDSDVPEPRISLGVWDEVGGEVGFALVGRRKG